MTKQQSKINKGRVILTHGRSLHSLVAAHSLGKRGIETIGCDSSPLMTLSFSKYVKDTFLAPPDDEGAEKFLEVLEEKIKEFQPEDDIPYVLMPMDRHTKLIATHKDRFRPHIRVATPDIESIRQVDPKNNLVETAWRLQIPIPPTWMPTTEDELQKTLDDISFPAFLKLPDGTGGVGIEKVESLEQLLSAYRRFQAEFQVGKDRVPLIQEAVGKEDYCVTVLMDKGQLKAHMTYKNITTFPSAGGFGVVRETVEAKKLVDISAAFLSTIGWNGVAELDYRWDGNENTPAYLIEINPRFWGGLFQSVESGVDYPWLLYQMTLSEDINPSPDPVVGTRTRIPLVSTLAELHDLFSDDEKFQEVYNSAKIGWNHLASGSLSKGFNSIAASIGKLLNPKDRIDQLWRWHKENSRTLTEIFSTDDPAASFGALYVLGTLVRTGKLPAEFSRDQDGDLLENPYQGEEK